MTSRYLLDAGSITGMIQGNLSVTGNTTNDLAKTAIALAWQYCVSDYSTPTNRIANFTHQLAIALERTYTPYLVGIENTLSARILQHVLGAVDWHSLALTVIDTVDEYPTLSASYEAYTDDRIDAVEASAIADSGSHWLDQHIEAQQTQRDLLWTVAGCDPADLQETAEIEGWD